MMTPTRCPTLAMFLMALLLGSTAASRVHTHTHVHHRSHRNHHAHDGQFLASGKDDAKDDDKDDAKDDAKDDEKDDDKDDDKEDDKDDDKEDDKDDEKDDDKDDGKDADDKKSGKADESKKEGKKEGKKDKEEEEEKSEEEEEVEKEEKVKSAAEVDLETAMKERAALKHEIEAIGDSVAFEAELNEDMKQVSNETQAQHLAAFLGNMWKEMRMFASPFYLKYLNKKVDALDKKIVTLEEKVAAEKAKEPAEKKEDDSVVPGVETPEIKAPDVPDVAATNVTDLVGGEKKKKKAEAKSGPTPMFREETMPKVSPTLQCLISLALQYFLVYTALAVIRTFNQFSGGSMFGLQKIIETACTTVTYAPMLSVLYLATRMRAIQLTQGETEKYQLPQPWVQSAMYISTYAVLMQVLLVVTVPIFTGEMNVKCDDQGNLDMSSMHSGGMIVKVISAVRYVAMALLYGSMVTICVGVFQMKAPKEIWGDKPPPVSPAVSCVMNLTFQFFGVYLAIAIVRTVVQFGVRSAFMTKLEGLLTLAKYTVNFAPMLCILFVGARMRALQIDPKHGNPQKWAQNCFYLCTYSVLLQTLLTIIMPFTTQCECKQGASEGDVIFVMANPTLGIVMTVIRYVCLVALYAGFTAVMVSVFLIEHPTDPSLTPPISPAMQCVMNLTCQYFTVYLAMFICITIKQFSPSLRFMDFLIGVFEAGQKTVMFAPMLSMLFIGARMRALQLTKATDGTIPPTAGPQPWAQDAMFLATWSVLVQLIMAMIVPLLTGTGKPVMDDDGNVVPPKGTNKYVGIACDVIKYLCLLSMYGGSMVVVYAVYTMTPETLPPYCEPSTLVPGVDVPKPPTPPTPSF